ncbi:hypothetical protein [Streptomyces albus]|uniref:hypothetical protein n=1 Tax=Streptomyces sp. NRRL F-5917 TaxID=1463873 RepID=UPI000A9D27ED|nr:hypothetical protein [Streptomyces sp. NRRL F-5917]
MTGDGARGVSPAQAGASVPLRGGRLWWQLLRVGRAAARGGQEGRLRFAGLLLATLAVALGAAAVVAGQAVHDGREARGSARAPQYTDPESPRAAVRLFPAYDTVGGTQKSLVYLRPAAKDAVPPPGVRRWPRPGEVLVSPALRRDLAREGTPDRYGTVVGTIAPEGLEVPDERLAYANPRDGLMDDDQWLAASGFGGTQRAHFGDADFVRPDSWFVLSACGFFLLPALALTVIAARAGAAGRDRRVALLRALGAGARARAWVSLGEALVPVAAGTLLAAVLVSTALIGDVRLPYVGFLLSAADLRRWAPALCAAVLGAGLLVPAVVVALHRARRSGTDTKPVAGGRFRAGRVAWLFPVFLVVAVYGTGLAAQGGSLAWIPVYFTGTVGVLATAPAVVALLVRRLGVLLVRAGNRRGAGGVLVAGRWVYAHPGTVTRLVATVVIAIGLVTQVQLHMSRVGAPVREARATHAELGDRVLLARMPDTPAQRRAFLGGLPAGTEAFALRTTAGPTGEPSRMTLTGSCAALAAVGGRSCDPRTADVTDRRLVRLGDWYLAPRGTLALHKGDPATAKGADQLLLLRGDGKPLPVPAVKQAAFRHMALADVEPLGGGELAGSAGWDAHLGAWIRSLGFLGIALLAFAALINNLGDFLHLGRRLAPLTVLAGNPRVFTTTALWAVGAPLVLAALLGCLTAWWLGSPMVSMAGATLPASFMLLLLAAATAFAATAWWWATRSTARTASGWHPGV